MINVNLASLKKGYSHQEYEWVIPDIDNRSKENISIISVFEILNKNNTDYEFNGYIEFSLKRNCDRCNDSYNASFKEDVRFLIKKNSDIEDIDIIHTNSNIVSLTSYIRDIVITAIPIKSLCSEKCKGQCPLCGINLNKEKCVCINKED